MSKESTKQTATSKLKGLNAILETNIPRPRPIPRIRGIYFLLLNSDVVYVGQSVDIAGRVLTHSEENKKEFTSYTFVEYDGQDMDLLEVRYIIKFQPLYNVAILSSRLGCVTKKRAAHLLGISEDSLSLFTPDVVFKGRQYFKLHEVKKEMEAMNDCPA